MSIAFKVLFAINLTAAAVLLFFFLWGLSDGSAYYALGTWLLILVAVAGLIWVSLALNRKGHKAASLVLLLPVAGPALLYGLFMLLIIILQPRWN